MILLISVLVFSLKFGITVAECTDIHGRSVTPNTHFIPGPDICQLCVCDNTLPKWCKRVLCSPPQNCKSFVMGSSCCDYSCLDNTLPSGELRDEIDRRFLITIATAFLILTVLLFIIHKLRHRTIHGTRMPGGRLQNRPFNEDRRSIGSIGFITGSIGYLNLPNGHHFDDHPLVHFPIYKPNANYFPRGEAPPPYDEAMADTALSVTYASQLMTHERAVPDIGQQRRHQFPNQLRVVAADENCVCEPRPVQNGAVVEESPVYNDSCVTQHRTIPLPLCVNTDQVDMSECSVPANGRSCPLHKKSNNNEIDQRGQANTTNLKRICVSGGRPNTCPPQFYLGAENLAEVYAPPQHRTLPLSASLSSPLPSTSDSGNGERPSQFLGGATSSSAANICSSSSEDGPAAPAVVLVSSSKKHHHHHHHHLSCKKLASAATNEEGQPLSAKEKKSSLKCLLNKERALAENNNNNKEVKEEIQETCQLVEDYYAECENCNLNVGADCDGPDEYFSKQETMTLQRKLHEASTAKISGQTMKVSLTLPTNSRTRRCPLKSRTCGPRSAKESPFKTNLEFVSSEGEEEAAAEDMKEKSKDDVKDVEQVKALEAQVTENASAS